MKKLIDEKGRLFGLINAIDALALLLALVLAGAFVLRAHRLADIGISQSDNMTDLKVRYQVTFYNVAVGHTEVIRVGDTIYSNGLPMGTITDVQVSDATLPSQRLDGSYVTAPVRERYRIVLTVESDAQRNDSGRLFIQKNEIALGSSHSFCTKYSLISGMITELNCDAV